MSNQGLWNDEATGDVEPVYKEEDAQGLKGGSIKNRPSRTTGRCRVPGCTADIPNSGKIYNLKYRICEAHLRLPSIAIDGQEQRFCQQCGKFQLLTAFDGGRRSCREQLARHNARLRNNRRQRSIMKLQANGGGSDGPASGENLNAEGAAAGIAGDMAVSSTSIHSAGGESCSMEFIGAANPAAANASPMLKELLDPLKSLGSGQQQQQQQPGTPAAPGIVKQEPIDSADSDMPLSKKQHFEILAGPAAPSAAAVPALPQPGVQRTCCISSQLAGLSLRCGTCSASCCVMCGQLGQAPTLNLGCLSWCCPTCNTAQTHSLPVQPQQAPVSAAALNSKSAILSSTSCFFDITASATNSSAYAPSTLASLASDSINISYLASAEVPKGLMDLDAELEAAAADAWRLQRQQLPTGPMKKTSKRAVAAAARGVGGNGQKSDATDVLSDILSDLDLDLDMAAAEAWPAQQQKLRNHQQQLWQLQYQQQQQQLELQWQQQRQQQQQQQPLQALQPRPATGTPSVGHEALDALLGINPKQNEGIAYMGMQFLAKRV